MDALDDTGGSFVYSAGQDDNMSSTRNMTLEDNSSAAHYEFFRKAQLVTGLVCYPTICLYGLIGNTLILIVMSRKPMHTSTNVYLSALAVSDMIKLLNDSLYFLTVLLDKTSPVAGNKAFGYLYPYAHFIFNMSVCIASWLTVSVAVERYILVCHPTRAQSIISMPRAKLISAAIYVCMTILAIPIAFKYQIVEIPNGANSTELDVELTSFWENNQKFVVGYTWVQSLLRSIIPLFILIFMNVFIINAMRKTRANKKLASRNRITIMLIIVIIFFLICITPDAVMSAFFNFGYAESSNYLVRGVREISDMLLALNCAMNFTLYIIFNKIFRDQFTSLCCARCKNNETEERSYKQLTHSKPVRHNNGETAENGGTNVAVTTV